MDICSQHEWNVSAWQASTITLLRHFKDKIILAGKNCTDVHHRKEFTTHAVCVIVGMTIFLLFAVLGSLSTAFEVFFERNAEKKDLHVGTDNSNDINNVQLKGDVNTSRCKAWLSKSKSFLQCFCFVKNGKRIFQTDSVRDQFKCFYGIRFFSNFFIIGFHVGLAYFSTKKSLNRLKPILQYRISMLGVHLLFAVDAFFVLSGFLNAYSFLKEYDKNNGKIRWWHFYLKRYIRLTPAFFLAFGFHTYLLSYTGSGPVWPEYMTNPVCQTSWWRYLLYINNFEASPKSCLFWCWHLAAELQLYIISPIFLLSLLRWPRFGYCLSCSTILLSCFSSFIITKHCNLSTTLFHLSHYLDDFETFSDRLWAYIDALYVMPYTRMSSYLIGMLLGYIFHDRNFKDNKNSLITLCCGWIIAAIFIWISFFSLFNREESLLETALYNSVKHIFFSVGLAWIIFVCLTGQGGFINSFLSWKLYFPFANLSYCVYLIHSIILHRNYQAAYEQEEISFLLLVLRGFGIYFLSLIISIPLSLLFELPFINLFHLCTNKRRDLELEEKRKKSL